MKNILWREHALARMAERSIERQAVIDALDRGEVLRDYPEDQPYPSRLLLHWIEGQPLHVVSAPVSDDVEIVITAYYPDPALWEPDFKRKLP
jgi:hypothetical protein